MTKGIRKGSSFDGPFLFTREQTAIQGIKEYSQYERGIVQQFLSVQLLPTSIKERGMDDSVTSFPSPLKSRSQYERGMGLQAHFISLDNSSLYERGIGQQTHFISFVALRVTAVGRNP